VCLNERQTLFLLETVGHARWVPEVAAPGGRSPGRRPLGLRRDRPVWS
jgi:hypothetical protein